MLLKELPQSEHHQILSACGCGRNASHKATGQILPTTPEDDQIKIHELIPFAHTILGTARCTNYYFLSGG